MTTPVATFSGLASGIDSATLIKGLVGLASAPVTRINDEKSDLSTRSRKLSDIKTKLTNLVTAAQALDTVSEATLGKATSATETVVKATTTGTPGVGNYAIRVDALAQAERSYSSTFSSSSEAGLFGTGTLDITQGDTSHSIDIDETDTLDSVVEKINRSGANVSAGLIFDGTNYRLQVASQETGAANAITFGETGSVALGLSLPDAEFQSAQDARIVVDDKLTITSATNTLKSAVPGVTLDLVSKSDTPVNVQVKRDPDALKTKLDTFVSAYNDVMKSLNAEFAYSGVAKGNGSLVSDSTMHSVQATLRSLATKALPEGTFSTLAGIGLSIQRDGTLSLDATKFSTAAKTDYDGVAKLLAAEGGATPGFMSSVRDAINPFVKADGTISQKIQNAQRRMSSLSDDVTRAQARVDKYEEQLRAKFTALESLVGGLNAQSQSLASIMNSVNK